MKLHAGLSHIVKGRASAHQAAPAALTQVETPSCCSKIALMYQVDQGSPQALSDDTLSLFLKDSIILYGA